MLLSRWETFLVILPLLWCRNLLGLLSDIKEKRVEGPTFVRRRTPFFGLDDKTWVVFLSFLLAYLCTPLSTV